MKENRLKQAWVRRAIRLNANQIKILQVQRSLEERTAAVTGWVETAFLSFIKVTSCHNLPPSHSVIGWDLPQ
jgi:hypothetical protein